MKKTTSRRISQILYTENICSEPSVVVFVFTLAVLLVVIYLNSNFEVTVFQTAVSVCLLGHVWKLFLAIEHETEETKDGLRSTLSKPFIVY